MAEDDYCPEEEEKAIGPKCDVCGQSTDSLYPVLVRRERRGMYEMVQIYLCAFHYVERMEEDAIPPPPEEDEKESIDDMLRELNPDNEGEDGDGWSRDPEGQSWG